MRLTALAVVALLVPALVSAQPFTFVSTPATDSVAVVDLSSNSVVATIPLGGLPTGCALARDGSRLYTALSESNALAMIDIVSGVLKTIPVGARPSGVAIGLGGRRVYVANTGADTVSVVDPARAVVETIAVGDGPVDLVASGRRLYVANLGAGTVSVIDTVTHSVLATISVGTFPAGLVLHGGSQRLYVANFFDDTVSAIDTAALSVLSTIPVSRGPRGLAVNAAGDRLFVAGFEHGRVQVIDTGTGNVVLEASSGGLNPLDLMLGPDGTRLYVAHLQASQGVAVLDTATLAQIASVNVPNGPVALAGIGPHSPPAAPLTARWMSAGRDLRGALRHTPASGASAPAGPQAGGGIVISDTEFNLADWSVAGTGTFDVSQELTGGDPGAWRRTRHSSSGPPVQTTHRLVRPGSQYDPSTQGPIVTLDVAWSHRLVSGPPLMSEAFCVAQAPFGTVYCTGGQTFNSTLWQLTSRLGLVAEDFTDENGFNPDFSADGGVITFGYRLNTPFKAGVIHGMDNFRVTVHQDPSGAGRLGFRQTFDAVRESDAPFVWVKRLGGTLGAVTVDVSIERPDGTVEVQTLSWADDDGFDKAILLLSLDLPPGSGARTARLTLMNPTGGATIEPTRGEMAIAVAPDEWPAILFGLFLRMQPLLSAFSPGWLLLLAVPAAALAARRVWSRARE